MLAGLEHGRTIPFLDANPEKISKEELSDSDLNKGTRSLVDHLKSKLVDFASPKLYEG
jgi:hypothetical protein